MFTGIIKSIGSIEVISKTSKSIDIEHSDLYIKISSRYLDISDIEIGDSISIQGVCTTVVDKNNSECSFYVNISQATLCCTTGLNQIGEKVNIEKSIRLNDKLSGHIIFGHVDGIGTVTKFLKNGLSYDLSVFISNKIKHYLIYKGSIAINGVSLTINSIKDYKNGCEFFINIVPYTLKNTTLKYLSPGKKINIEVDIIAKYVKRILSILKYDK